MPIYEIAQKGGSYVGYDYKTIIVDGNKMPMYLDCYESFGWILKEQTKEGPVGGFVKLTLKRDRKIVNKAELTRLQQHFEACVEQIDSLERSKTQKSTVVSLVVGMLGTAFMAGSVFAVTSESPLVLLCVLLAIPGFVGWGLAYPFFKRFTQKRIQEVMPLIEEKLEEIHDICERGYRLLND